MCVGESEQIIGHKNDIFKGIQQVTVFNTIFLEVSFRSTRQDVLHVGAF